MSEADYILEVLDLLDEARQRSRLLFSRVLSESLEEKVATFCARTRKVLR